MKYAFAIFLSLSIVLLSFTFVPPQMAQASTGISTCAGLESIGSGLSGNYILTGSVDCSGYGNFTPVGTFTGTLDGQGYSITGLTVNHGGSNDQALFSSTNGAVIRNLNIPGATIEGNYQVAILVASATNTIITNVAVSNSGTLFALASTSDAGGLVGYASNSIITYSHSSVYMNAGGSNVGGLVGATSNGTIISNSYSTGTVNGSTGIAYGGNVGGLVGDNESSTIVDSYSRASVGTGVDWTFAGGGLVGLNNGSTALINRSYSTGAVTTAVAGGLVGSETGSASTTNSFWDTQSSGNGSSADGTGKNTSQMQTQGTFVSGWDFTNVWSISASQYPALRSGDVTPPAAPTGFTAVATSTTVALNWTNPADLDFASIYIQRSTSGYPSNMLSGTRATSVASPTATYSDTGLADATYYYSIFAIDTNGNSSLAATASARVDTTPPGPATGFTATPTGSTVALSWTNPTDGDFGSVTIRRSTTGYPTTSGSDSPVTSGISTTSYSDTSLPDGIYYYSIFALDTTGNVSTAAHAATTVDTVAPVISVLTPIASHTNNATPSYIFSTNEAGTISYGGSCSSATTLATVGSNTVAFNHLADGTYSNCTVTVTDSHANASIPLSVASFTVDTVAPVLTAGTQVSSRTLAAKAIYTFTPSETGAYSLSGCPGSVSAGEVLFNGLVPGTTYACTLSLTDAAGNVSNTLSIGPFTVYAPSRGGLMPIVNVATGSGAPLGFTVSGITNGSNGPEVMLGLNADPKTVQGYAVSVDPAFQGVGILPFGPSVPFVLPKTYGTDTIYLKYYSTTGNPSSVITRSIVVGAAPAEVQSQNSTSTLIPNPTPNQDPLSRTLRLGMQGSDVLFLQQFLNAHGISISGTSQGSSGSKTPYFGILTKTAVIKYQKARNIVPANGMVGPLTRAAILKDLASTKS